MLSSGLVFADESGAFSSPTFTTAEAGFHLDYGSDQMTEHAIDERTIDRLELSTCPTVAGLLGTM